MDHHKVLYKDNRSHTIRQHVRINRELQEANRTKRRRDRFQDSRNISPSPINEDNKIIIPLCPEDKENLSNTNLQQNPNSTRLVKIVCNGNDPEKLTKQEAFIKRFVEWKENKKNIKNQESQTYKKKPFVSAVNTGRQTTAFSSLVPGNHHKGFRPPVGLKNPANKKVEENKNPVIRGRQSIYTVVATPPRKIDEKCTNKIPIARKKMPVNLQTKALTTNSTPNCANKLEGTVNKVTEKKSNIKTPGNKKLVARKSPTVSTAKATAVNFTKVLENVKTTTKATSAQPPLRKDLRGRSLKMPPLPSTRSAATAPSRPTGAITKITKRTEVANQTKKSHLKSGGGARLAQNLKAKKVNKKVNLPAIQINGKKIINLLKKNEAGEDMIMQTPIDFATLNHFDEFVTSTKIKNSSDIENEGLSTTATSHKKSHMNSSAKRNILTEAINSTLVNECDQKGEHDFKGVKKYNFLRYSEAGNVTVKDGCDIDETLVKEKSKASSEKTPIKSGPEERPSNYLSPFVSVSRGKVSLKKEREKRNSIYLQNVSESNDLPTERMDQNTAPNYSVEVRRTLETVRYFRKQLQDQIDRLHKLCDVWEVYKKENLQKIQNANGEDMINVTIGQTRLLTSKKFMQFKGLIDRCEAGATGINDVAYDGSENTKPITSGDLEGFWSMLGIQIDNLDQRFDNLNRWKLNEWNDPDENTVEIKKKSTKVKKVKAAPAAKTKANSALQQMLRKMQAEMRKNKNKNDFNEVVVLTSSKLKQRRSANSTNTTPRKSIDTSASRRLSITVKDRKYYSPAATVISVLSSNHRTPKSSQDSPITKHVQKFNEALDSMQSSLGLRKSVLINENSRSMSLKQQPQMVEMKNNDCKSPLNSGNTKSNHKSSDSQSLQQSPVTTGRKSILKTPGTAKSKLRNVIFNEKLRVKKFNFLMNEDGGPFSSENSGDMHEEDLYNSCEEELQMKGSPLRTLTLRNRKVRLRPSSEIVIPKK